MQYFITDGGSFIEPASSTLQKYLQRDVQFALIERLASALAEAAQPVWESGDGYGGDVLNLIYYVFDQYGLEPNPQRSANKYGRKKIPEAIRIAVHERNGFKCIFCKTPTNLTIDHIIPVVKGGTNDLENLQTLCRSCNSKKGIK
jgi:hypothetical protein